MGIRHHEPHAAKAAPGEAAQELDPERLSLAVTDGHAQHFAPAVGVDAHRDDHGDGDDLVVAPDFHVGGVQPDIGPVALDRAVEEGLNALVDKALCFANAHSHSRETWLLEMPLMPIALTSSSTWM